MGTTYAIGSDGNIELPSGFNAQLQSWSCNISRSTQVVTGFTDTGQRRKQSTLVDVTGSAGAIPIYNASTTQPFNLSGTTMDDAAGGTVSLFVSALVSMRSSLRMRSLSNRTERSRLLSTSRWRTTAVRLSSGSRLDTCLTTPSVLTET
jgi:hypothetical protein